jgi:hypothetical protein
MICPCHETHPFGSGVDQPRMTNSSDKPKSVRAVAHTNQASHVAARAFI